MIYIFSGLPGKGKTANATLLAVKEYKRTNNYYVFLIKSLITRFKTFFAYFGKAGYPARYLYQLCIAERIPFTITNNIYSNYPILLDKKRNIYSNYLSLNDLDMNYQFPPNSTLILDEAQKYFDSRDFKKFPKDIGTFLQHHRHGDIKNIVLVTQHPRRLDNKMRDLSEVFRKYRTFLKVPFIPYALVIYTDYFEFEDYGKYNHVKKEYRTYDYQNKITLANTSLIFDHYNSKYFNIIFKALPHADELQYTSKDLTDYEVKRIS